MYHGVLSHIKWEMVLDYIFIPKPFCFLCHRITGKTLLVKETRQGLPFSILPSSNTFIYDFPHSKVAMVAMLIFMPDSPKYLITKSRTPQARKALQWFRGPKVNVDIELRFLT